MLNRSLVVLLDGLRREEIGGKEVIDMEISWASTQHSLPPSFAKSTLTSCGSIHGMAVSSGLRIGRPWFSQLCHGPSL